MRRAMVIAFLLGLAVLAVEMVAGGEPAPAKHREGAGEGRGASCWIKPNANPTLPGTITRGCVPALARNIIGDGNTAGKAIPVCAETEHDDSTKAAIIILNKELGRTVFRWAGAPTAANCGHSTSGTTITSVVISAQYTGSTTDPQPLGCRTSLDDAPSFACIRHFSVKSSHVAYYGRAEIRVHPYLDVVTAAETKKGRTMYGTCAPAGHTFDKNTTRVRICNSATRNIHDGLSGQDRVRVDGTLELTRHLAHELLHVLGMRDYFCGDDPLDEQASLMDSNFRPACRTPRMQDANRNDATKAMLVKWDLDDYRGIYNPTPVEKLHIDTKETQKEKLRLRWTATNVHAEKGFRVERKVGTNAWRPVTGAVTGPNKTTVLFDKPSSSQTYRLVSLTDALTAAELKKLEATWPTVTYTAPKSTSGNGGTSTGGTGGTTKKPSSCSGTRYLSLGARPAKAADAVTVSGHTRTSGPPTRWHYSCGSTATLTAQKHVTRPAGFPDWQFLRWEGACSGTTPTCSLKMDVNRSAVAVYQNVAKDSKPKPPPTTTPKPTATPRPTGGVFSVSSNTVTVTSYRYHAQCSRGIGGQRPRSRTGPWMGSSAHAAHFGGQWVKGTCPGDAGSVSVESRSSQRTVYSWSASCNGNGRSGSGGGIRYQSTALSRASAWVAGNCN